MLIRRQPPKPTMIDETLIEGYIVLYDLRYRIGKNLFGYVSHKTKFDNPKFELKETILVKVSINYGVIDNPTTIEIGFIERIIKTDIGVKVQIRVKDKDNLEALKEKYLARLCLLTIFSEPDDIVIKDGHIERWPISSLYFVNIPFSPMLN